MDTFDLKAYLKENLLFEEDLKLSDEQLKLVAKAVKQPVEKVEKVTTGQEKVTEEELNEVALTTVVTIVGLIPIMMEAIGGLSNWIARNTGKNKAEIAQLKIFTAKIEDSSTGAYYSAESDWTWASPLREYKRYDINYDSNERGKILSKFGYDGTLSDSQHISASWTQLADEIFNQLTSSIRFYFI